MPSLTKHVQDLYNLSIQYNNFLHMKDWFENTSLPSNTELFYVFAFFVLFLLFDWGGGRFGTTIFLTCMHQINILLNKRKINIMQLNYSRIKVFYVNLQNLANLIMLVKHEKTNFEKTVQVRKSNMEWQIRPLLPISTNCQLHSCFSWQNWNTFK